MVGIEDLELTKIVQCRVSKLEVSLAEAHRLDDGSVSNATEGHHNGIVGQRPELIGKKLITRIDFGTDRFVVRRQALHGVGDAAIDEFETIIERLRMFARPEAVLVKHLVEQDAGMIACKRAARSIGTMHTGSQAYNKEARIQGSKRRHRTTIIIRISPIHFIEKFR
jgi:hypothetical protein